MNDLTVTEDYALARRFNDSIDLMYVHARRAVKRYREELDFVQQIDRPRITRFLAGLESMREVLLSSFLPIVARDDMEARHELERQALATRHEAERVAHRRRRNSRKDENARRLAALVAENDAALAAGAGQEVRDTWHEDIAAEQAAEKALLRGEK
jgi:hypothetical protein